MSQDLFQKAEDEYFRLKGQRAAGRITQAQFEAALKELIFQDAQGRYWMLGVDSAKWYVYNGKSWVASEPGGSSLDASPTPAPSQPTAAPSESAADSRRSPNLKIAAMGLAILICLGLIVVGVLIFSNPDFQRVVLGVRSPVPLTFATLPSITRAPPVTITPLATGTSIPTLAPTLTPLPTATMTLIPSPTPRPEGNCSDSGAQWENVTDGQRIDPYAAMQGTASVADFDQYVVEYLRPGNVLYRSRTPVVHNVLFVWNTNTVSNGDYLLALIVYLKDGSNLAPCVIRVRVQH